MPSARDFLERLRPSGTPGAPSASGVPADRAAERSAELESVFSRLAGVQVEAEQLRSRGQEEAQCRRDAAAERARAIVSEARRRVEAERAAAAASGQAEAKELARMIGTDAQAEATALAGRARDRQSAFVELVVRRARAELSDLIADAS